MDLIYTDADHNDVGVLHDFTLDLAFGADENDFELTVDLSNHCCEINSLIYVEGTEYGGIIDGLSVVTADEKLSYTGRTWHGILNSKVIEPYEGEDYVIVSGDANNVISNLLQRVGLDGLFVASTEKSGLTVEDYKFDRYVSMYTGISKMLDAISGKLKISAMGESVILSAVPSVDYSQDEQFDNDAVALNIEKTKNVVNHLICLGKGELADRTVIHLYMDAYGNISQTQTFYGLQEIIAIYDYPNADSEEKLLEGGIEVFLELAGTDKIQLDFDPDEVTYDIGDIIGAKELVTNTVTSARINKKIVTINRDMVNIQYKVGE